VTAGAAATATTSTPAAPVTLQTVYNNQLQTNAMLASDVNTLVANQNTIMTAITALNEQYGSLTKTLLGLAAEVEKIISPSTASTTATTTAAAATPAIVIAGAGSSRGSIKTWFKSHFSRSRSNTNDDTDYEDNDETDPADQEPEISQANNLQSNDNNNNNNNETVTDGTTSEISVQESGQPVVVSISHSGIIGETAVLSNEA